MNLVTLHDVGVAYDGYEALQHVDLEIGAEDFLGVIGPNGGGKTTLCNLIPRFYEVTSGRILIDGQDIRRVTLKSLRQDIGIVQQDVYLFSGTVAQNIAYGKPDASLEEVVAAAKAAHADSFIRRLPDGYQTMLSGDGANLSQGQRQLLLTVGRRVIAAALGIPHDLPCFQAVGA